MLGNVAMGPLFHGVPKRDALSDARDWLRMVGLAGFEDRHPHQLSGVITGPVNLPATYTNSYAITANKALGYSG